MKLESSYSSCSNLVSKERFSNVEIRRVDSKVKKMRKSFKLSPLCLCPCTVVVYSQYSAVFPSISFSTLSFVAHHPGAAVTVIEIVSESHHAAGAGVICADSPLSSLRRSRRSDRFNGFCASRAPHDFYPWLALVHRIAGLLGGVVVVVG